MAMGGSARSTMYSKAKVFGHPLHPVLVSFPVAFYTTTAVAYLSYAATGKLFCFQVGVVANVAGVLTAVLAAVPGFIDWRWGVPGGHPAKSMGLLHMGLNVTTLVLATVNAAVQIHKWSDIAPTAGLAVVFSILCLFATALAGYLGGELVQRHHVGIDLTPEQSRLDVGAHARITDNSSPSGRWLS